MAKKSTNTPASIALFNDFEESKLAVKKSEPKKEISSLSSNLGSKSELKKESKQESKPKTKKAVKNDTGKSKSTSINKSSNSASSKSSKSASNSKTKKEVKETSGRKQRGTSSAAQKSKTSKRSAASNADRNDKDLNKAVKSRKSVKDNSKPSKDENPSTRKLGKKSDNSTRGNKEVERPKQRDSAANEEIIKSAKRATKTKRSRTNVILPPKQITGKPKSIRDDLVAIVVDGEYLEVSPWSVKNGVYHQGLDSNFLVKYLHYEPVATKYDEYDKKKENN